MSAQAHQYGGWWAEHRIVRIDLVEEKCRCTLVAGRESQHQRRQKTDTQDQVQRVRVARAIGELVRQRVRVAEEVASGRCAKSNQ
jgi:hypothetical protein